MTKRKFNSFFKKIGSSLLIWICAAYLFGFIRVWGVESLPAFERLEEFDLPQFSALMLVLGLSIGIPFGIIDTLLDNQSLRTRSYGKIISIKVLVQVLIAIFSLTMLVVINNLIDDVRISFVSFIVSKTSLLWIIYSGIVSLLIYFFEVIRTKIGDRVLFNLILGKYHNPRVETRIFMFLDMKDSTTHGEKLGHIKFSSLIQDSLNDLTTSIIRHKVEVYQYVGDEAVLTWNLDEGFEHANCLEMYYSFMNTLNERKDYYEQKYGFVPFFKAGVHLGEVTVSEVGIVKREIAYHSDVLNTAARIQGKCNDFKAELLISEELENQLTETDRFEFQRIGGISLKGKEQVVHIFKVTQK